MDIATRKVNFIQEFLQLKDEDLIAKMEKLLQTKTIKTRSNNHKPMSVEEFNKMIDKAEDDFANGREITSKELLERIETWE
jgi:hypothetical protein